MVAFAGGSLGVAGAFWLVRALRVMESFQLPAPEAIRVDPTVLAFAAGITLLTGLLAGLAPALAASRPNLQLAIKGSSPGTARGWSGGLRSTLVITEVALALVLLLGAGLLLRSMQKLLSVPMGFEPGQVLTLRLRLQSQRYREPAQSAAFVRNLLERVRALPGVQSAAVISSLPLTNYNQGRTLYFEDATAPAAAPAERPSAATMSVTPAYFATFGIPVLAGRGVEEADGPGAPLVAVVNRAFARRFYGAVNPVGHHLRFGGTPDPQPWITIAGVAGDVRHMGPDHEVEPELYFPFAQQPLGLVGLAVRCSAAPEMLSAALRREILALDSDLAIFNLSTMSNRLSKATGPQRLELALVGFFALLATVLAALGVYGVIAYAVSQSTREIGVRLALGAAPGAVQRAVVGRGLKLGLTGVALGLAAGYALTTLMASLLFQTEAHDTFTFTGAGAVLLAVVLLASYWPARRAARVDPMVALRWE